jgi:spore maturation protein CgeB
MLRVLFLGENWYGSCARACAYALRRHGCEVMDVDVQTIFPQLRLRSSRVALRLIMKHLICEYNQRVLDTAAQFEPDLLLAFKGSHATVATLRELRRRNIALYNYYPDRMVFACGTLAEDSIPEYDCVFDTKRFWDGDIGERIRVRKSVFIPHGYDKDIHGLTRVDARDTRQYGCDVGVIATHLPMKEQILHNLLTLRPHLNLHIWGNQWSEYCRSKRVRECLRGAALTGVGYAKAIRCTRINLGILGVTPEAKDETTTRTYEIPACGGFMLHERSPEVLELYKEGEEVACFSSPQELAEKIDYYLAHPEERDAIAGAGHRRCVPAYSYDNRMAEILRWHEQYKQQTSKVAAVVTDWKRGASHRVDNNPDCMNVRDP